MPTLLEELKQVQPCDGRGLIQILSQRIIRELIAAKRAACEEVAETLAGYGIDDIYPCDYLTEEFLEKLLSEDPIDAISSALVKAGYPPHLLKIFTKGFDELTDKELQEVLKWTEPITGIQVHQNTAKYLRTEVEQRQNTTLQKYIVSTISTIEVPFQSDLTLRSTTNETATKAATDEEIKKQQRLAELPPRIQEIVTGTGPKLTSSEWSGDAFDGTTLTLVIDYITEGLINPDIYNNLQLLERPVNQGGFGAKSSLWQVTRNDDIALEEVIIIANKVEPKTVTQQVVTNTVEFEEVTTTSTVTIGPLTKEEVEQVEKFYLDQGIRSIIAPFATTLKTKVFDKITCPAPERLNKLITRIQNLSKIVNKLKERLTKLSQFLNIASATVSLINTIIDVLKKVILAAGPVIIALSVDPITRTIAIILNKITQVCQTLITKYEPKVEKLDKSLCAAAKALTFAVANINVVDAFIRIIDELLRNCVKDDTDLGIASTLAPVTGFAGAQSYRGFELEIRVRPSSNSVKQRYAVALDSNGGVIVQGPFSFSADADILLEELKYRIDTYLG